ncbi:acetyl-CoA carboxylase biotin carboxylase subunit family protein [Jannaschia sp. M317]|uniref:ATP-grasp domain-containing protein n=1 Tax=Jannaschia sp. M317 TaxID=2867011 RepID=UPI0021A688F2|nr:ATP-grasp domain-containing protein [Jannaschia sp. M317]UWQ19676.1 ATP-grasp domain-containing protein [Jannaschia sp. M317]
MKKFLVLGIGNAQVDLLEYLSGSFEVHALANSTEARGYSLADVFGLVNIADPDAVLEYAKANEIDYVYSVGSDVAMPSAMYVAEQLGLPHFVSSRTAVICNNKVKLRTELAQTYGALEFSLLEDGTGGRDIPLPAMLKPVDSQGQRGVQTITSHDEIPAAFETAIAFSRSGKAILERKVDGVEISVNAYMVDGELVFFLPSDRLAWAQFDGGIIRKHILPTTLSDQVVANVRRLAEESLKALEIRNGPAYFQIKIDAETPRLIEVTPRLDGCHMWRLIRATTGVDLLDASIRHLQGDTPVFPKDIPLRAGVLEFLCQPPGETFHRVETDPEAETLVWYYDEGQKVSRMNGYMEKAGFQIVVDPA